MKLIDYKLSDNMCHECVNHALIVLRPDYKATNVPLGIT